MNKILLKNMKIVNYDSVINGDILISNGKISEIGENIPMKKANAIIDGANTLIAIPSLFDMHVHFRDPGFTHKEDILTGASAALAGGFTGVLTMPNTNPPIDNPETAQYVIKKGISTGVKIYPVGCITKGLSGSSVCNYDELKAAGVIALSDDGKPVQNEEILLNALELSKENGLLIISHCEDLKIIGNGIINKGRVSEQLGVSGMDRLSEDSITEREISLAEKINARIHIAHVSTKGSVELIRLAKQRGVKVTAETCPHYFTFTEDKLLAKDADYRMNPPLREESDRIAVLNGVIDGTIDCIVTDHAPHTAEEKSDFITAPNGVVGLETSLAATLTGLYHTNKLSISEIVKLMSFNPRKILNLPEEKIFEGFDANITIINPLKEWIVDPAKFHSKSRNTVFKGVKLTGMVVATISEGQLKYNNMD